MNRPSLVAKVTLEPEEDRRSDKSCEFPTCSAGRKSRASTRSEREPAIKQRDGRLRHVRGGDHRRDCQVRIRPDQRAEKVALDHELHVTTRVGVGPDHQQAIEHGRSSGAVGISSLPRLGESGRRACDVSAPERRRGEVGRPLRVHESERPARWVANLDYRTGARAISKVAGHARPDAFFSATTASRPRGVRGASRNIRL